MSIILQYGLIYLWSGEMQRQARIPVSAWMLALATRELRRSKTQQDAAHSQHTKQSGQRTGETDEPQAGWAWEKGCGAGKGRRGTTGNGLRRHRRAMMGWRRWKPGVRAGWFWRRSVEKKKIRSSGWWVATCQLEKGGLARSQDHHGMRSLEIPDCSALVPFRLSSSWILGRYLPRGGDSAVSRVAV